MIAMNNEPFCCMCGDKDQKDLKMYGNGHICHECEKKSLQPQEMNSRSQIGEIRDVLA